MLSCYNVAKKLESGWNNVDKTLENDSGIPEIATKTYGPQRFEIILDGFFFSRQRRYRISWNINRTREIQIIFLNIYLYFS